jgi:hypothetical protein
VRALDSESGEPAIQVTSYACVHLRAASNLPAPLARCNALFRGTVHPLRQVPSTRSNRRWRSGKPTRNEPHVTSSS